MTFKQVFTKFQTDSVFPVYPEKLSFPIENASKFVLNDHKYIFQCIILGLPDYIWWAGSPHFYTLLPY